jgi:hypothetical protein
MPHGAGRGWSPGHRQRLAIHPAEPWLIGTGGGNGNGALVFWKLDGLPSVAVGQEAPTTIQRRERRD